MGLISRVSSRTYRSPYTFSYKKMFRLTRVVRHLTPRQAKHGTGIHDGLRPRIQPKTDISALIQVSRWVCLIYGIYYGNKRYHEIAKRRGCPESRHRRVCQDVDLVW